MALFESTAFGVSRSLHRMRERADAENALAGDGAAAAGAAGAGAGEQRYATGGRHGTVAGAGPSTIVRRQKAVVPRSKPLESAMVLMKHFSAQLAILTVEFDQASVLPPPPPPQHSSSPTTHRALLASSSFGQARAAPEPVRG